MNNKAKELERKAKALRQKQKLTKNKAATVITTKKVTYLIHTRNRPVIERESETLKEVFMWVLKQIPVDDLYEIHDSRDRLLWGRSTKLSDLYDEKVHGKI